MTLKKICLIRNNRILPRILLPTIIVSVLTLLLSTIFFFNCSADDYDTATDLGKTIGRDFVNKTKSQEALRERLINPLMNSNTPLNTFDDSKSGNAQIVCPSSKEFLTVMVQRESAGDITVMAQWDSNLDGIQDKSIQLKNITAVCSNGFIACSPGTLPPGGTVLEYYCDPVSEMCGITGQSGGCSYYQTRLSNGNLTLVSISYGELSGCMCVRADCGTNVTLNNFDYIANQAGSAIVSGIQQADARYTISNTVSQGEVVKFYGMTTKGCSTAGGGTGLIYPESLYTPGPAGDTAIKSTLTDVTMSQASNPTSMYSMLQTSYQNTQMMSDQKTCFIKRDVYFKSAETLKAIAGTSKDLEYQSSGRCILANTGSESVLTKGRFLWGWDGDQGDGCSTCESFMQRIDMWDPFSQSWWGVWDTCYKISGDPGVFPSNDHLRNVFTLYIQNVLHFTGSVDSITDTSNTGQRIGGGECYGSSGGSRPLYEANFYASFTINTYNCFDCNESNITETVTNTCDQYENDSNCTRWNEKREGVLTISHGAGTGMQPVSTCKQISASNAGFNCNLTFCRDFWNIERTYLCSQYQVDLTDAKTRMQQVTNTTNIEQQGQIYYSDMIKDKTGAWKNISNQKITYRGAADPNSCEKACKVRTATGISVGERGPVSTQQLNPDQNIYFYRACIEDTCPTKEGETVVEGCKCSNDFNLSTSTMAVLRQASQDMVCTNNNYVTLP